jgi:hypothetical protein
MAQLMLQVPLFLPSWYSTRALLWANAVRFMPHCAHSAGGSTFVAAQANVAPTTSNQVANNNELIFMGNLLVVAVDAGRAV